MPLFFANGKIVFFVHIPKTGGMTIEKALRDASAREALNFPSRFNNSMSCTTQHWHAELHQKLVPSNFYDFGFCVVRHPFARIASEYRYLEKMGNKLLPFDDWVKKWLRIALRRNRSAWDNHLRPQHEFISPSIQVSKLEDGLLAPINEALHKLVLPPVSSIESENIAGQNKPPLAWSEESFEQAYKFYQKDFVKFGYVPEDSNILIE